MLDKYTNLGIYIITHTFTLAELFTVRPPPSALSAHAGPQRSGVT